LVNANEQFMRRAIDLAVENVRSGRGGPFAAVVVKDGRIIAEGTNLVTSTNDPTAHAEVVAIRAACATLHTFQLDTCEIYTSCEPCPMCLGAIYWARPARIFYGGTHKEAAAAGFDDSFIYQQTRMPVADRAVPMIQVLHDEAQAPFQAWIQSASKVPY
jgi:tRNA(Arg) A34 adenosine deaminase TadA